LVAWAKAVEASVLNKDLSHLLREAWVAILTGRDDNRKEKAHMAQRAYASVYFESPFLLLVSLSTFMVYFRISFGNEKNL
jgi:hypothetical protein